MKGSYILLIELLEQEIIPVGRLGPITFPRGFYAYVGSAMGGIEARVNRHLGKRKKAHWHIDYLLDRAPIREVFVIESEKRAECTIARALAEILNFIPRFGCSDCHCQSHLFFAEQGNALRPTVLKTLSRIHEPMSSLCFHTVPFGVSSRAISNLTSSLRIISASCHCFA